MLHKLRPNCAKLCKLKPSYPSALLSVSMLYSIQWEHFIRRRFRSVTQALFLVVLLSTSLFPPKSRQIDQKTCHQQHRFQSFCYSMMGAKVVWISSRTNHCTIGYAMKIKKKKMFKSKHLVFAHFSTKTGDFFGIDGKIPMFCHKYFLKSKMWFFLVILAKKLELLVW